MQLDHVLLRPQTHTSNRPDSSFVPLVGESAVRLSHVGLAPMRIEGLPAMQEIDGGKLLRARRDRVGRLGEFRAFVLEDGRGSIASIAFVPRPSLDLGIFGTEIVSGPSGVSGTFSIYAGTGTWFAGQHAHRACQELKRAAPDLVPDDGPRNARARERGFAFDVQLDRNGLERAEDVHRRLWSAYVRSLSDALELDVEGTEKNARAIEAWKAHRRTVSLTSRVLADSRSHEAARVHADVIAA